MIIVYGIKNCDSVKRALQWLKSQNINAKLHDYRENGITETFIHAAIAQFGWENVINKRSATWRNLDEATQKTLGKTAAPEILLSHPTLLKRPIILQGEIALIGFNEAQYRAVFNH